MIAFIKNQNKDRIIPFNRIIYLETEYDDTTTIRYDDDQFVEGVILGKYKTKERAKEILQDILDWYDDLMSDVAINNAYTLFYFTMPEE